MGKLWSERNSRASLILFNIIVISSSLFYLILSILFHSILLDSFQLCYRFRFVVHCSIDSHGIYIYKYIYIIHICLSVSVYFECRKTALYIHTHSGRLIHFNFHWRWWLFYVARQLYLILSVSFSHAYIYIYIYHTFLFVIIDYYICSQYPCLFTAYSLCSLLWPSWKFCIKFFEL